MCTRSCLSVRPSVWFAIYYVSETYPFDLNLCTQVNTYGNTQVSIWVIKVKDNCIDPSLDLKESYRSSGVTDAEDLEWSQHPIFGLIVIFNYQRTNKVW